MAKLALPRIFKRKTQKPKKKKSLLREWFDALVWAAGVAILIRMFLFELYVIPTGSMERTLMVGDYLVVSKFHYGTRLPMVPLAIPFIHNRIPGTNTRSFLDWIQFGYARIPGFSSIKRGDIVVFNYPADDRNPNNPALGSIDIPSAKENYVKRCVAVSGDSVAMRAGRLYVNGELQPLAETGQFEYVVRTDGGVFNPKALERLGIRPNPISLNNPNGDYYRDGLDLKLYHFHVTHDVANQLAQFSNVDTVYRDTSLLQGMPSPTGEEDMFPYDKQHFPYNVDWLGPYRVPHRGMKIRLDPRTAVLYDRCIRVYEDNPTFRVMNGEVQIEGKPVTEYTFKMDYYYMMGDNRRNSQDARVWGFVPEDHVVGKPVLVVFSREGKVRWERFFKLVH